MSNGVGVVDRDKVAMQKGVLRGKMQMQAILLGPGSRERRVKWLSGVERWMGWDGWDGWMTIELKRCSDVFGRNRWRLPCQPSKKSRFALIDRLKAQTRFEKLRLIGELLVR